MKSTMRKMLAVGAVLVAAQSWGYTIQGGTTDVGGLDTLLGTTSTISEQGFASFLNGYLGTSSYDSADVSRYDNTAYYQVDGYSTYYAVLLNDAVDYFSIKKKSSNAAIFANTSKDAWAVFDVTGWGFDPNIKGSAGALSHHDEVGGSTSVPEPGSVSLLAAGMLGLAAARRLAKRSAK